MNKENSLNIFVASLLAILVIGCSEESSTASSTTSSATTGTSNVGLGPTTPTGTITHREFRILFSESVVPIIDENQLYTEQNVEITVKADDINDLQVDGRVVNFATEWGTFTDSDSCTLINGECTVNWIPGNSGFVPANCRVAFTAWTIGEEKFQDNDADGLFDTGETFTDLEEPFLDIDDDGVFDASPAGCNADLVCEFIDIVNFDGTTPGSTNGSHNNADTKYNGTLCATPGTAPCDGPTSVMIHTRSRLIIQTPFADADDLNGNGNTNEEINVCVRGATPVITNPKAP